MRTISKDQFLAYRPYYQKILVLSELANMNSEVIANRIDKTESGSDTADQIQSDVIKIKQTIDEGQLPEEHADKFRSIIGMRNQLENNPNLTTSATFNWDSLSESQRHTIDRRVASSLHIDQELGYATDEAMEWFYRRFYSGRLLRESP
jgi:hypothetical protein